MTFKYGKKQNVRRQQKPRVRLVMPPQPPPDAQHGQKENHEACGNEVHDNAARAGSTTFSLEKQDKATRAKQYLFSAPWQSSPRQDGLTPRDSHLPPSPSPFLTATPSLWK